MPSGFEQLALLELAARELHTTRRFVGLPNLEVLVSLLYEKTDEVGVPETLHPERHHWVAEALHHLAQHYRRAGHVHQLDAEAGTRMIVSRRLEQILTPTLIEDLYAAGNYETPLREGDEKARD